MKRIAWGTVPGLGIAALLALGLPARAHDKSGTSGSSASGQSSDTSSSAQSSDESSSGSSSSTMGTGSTSPDTTSPGSSATSSGDGTGTGSSSSGTSGTGASASSDQASSKQLSGTVERFDKDSNQLTLSSSDKKLTLNDDTTVTKNGEKASTSDIHEGDQVRASYSGSGDDVDVVGIEILPADAAPSTGK